MHFTLEHGSSLSGLSYCWWRPSKNKPNLSTWKTLADKQQKQATGSDAARLFGYIMNSWTHERVDAFDLAVFLCHSAYHFAQRGETWWNMVKLNPGNPGSFAQWSCAFCWASSGHSGRVGLETAMDPWLDDVLRAVTCLRTPELLNKENSLTPLTKLYPSEALGSKML